MIARKFAWMVAVVIAMALAAGAQQTQPSTQIKHVPMKPTNAASGAEMYTNYCAVCHGKDGKGNGPATPALKIAPTDLTTLAQKNGGKYPALHVTSVIRGEGDLPAHGSKDMPVWGPLFWRMSQGHEAEVQQRIVNLNQYIESLQVK
jgi:mono/diheme cytochrome c family protein